MLQTIKLFLLNCFWLYWKINSSRYDQLLQLSLFVELRPSSYSSVWSIELFPTLLKNKPIPIWPVASVLTFYRAATEYLQLKCDWLNCFRLYWKINPSRYDQLLQLSLFVELWPSSYSSVWSIEPVPTLLENFSLSRSILQLLFSYSNLISACKSFSHKRSPFSLLALQYEYFDLVSILY